MTKTKKSASRKSSLPAPETTTAASAAPLSEQSSTTSAAASEAVASASEGTPAATPIVLLELNRIVCSTYNPRRNLNESSLDELALSMQQTGQLQPICVRGSGEHYEIVYGERRYRAAQRAGFTHIKALVYEHLTDEDAEDMAITENLQREDVAPLEEAAAFLRALKTGRHTVTTLVDKFGKSERYIRSHLKLNDLIEPLANLLEREEIIESMAIELAKYPSEVQQCVFEEHFANDGHNSWKNTSPRQVGQYLHDRYMTKLNTYKFDKTECSTCAENTANNILFSDLAEGCAGCENRSCMIRKNDEFLVEKAIRMQRNDPRTLLAVEVGRYSDAVLERLTSQGYTVEVIDTYSMWEPDVPVLPDVEVPQESDYEDRDEYLEALAEYESEVSEYRENMKKLELYSVCIPGYIRSSGKHVSCSLSGKTYYHMCDYMFTGMKMPEAHDGICKALILISASYITHRITVGCLETKFNPDGFDGINISKKPAYPIIKAVGSCCNRNYTDMAVKGSLHVYIAKIFDRCICIGICLKIRNVIVTVILARHLSYAGFNLLCDSRCIPGKIA